MKKPFAGVDGERGHEHDRGDAEPPATRLKHPAMRPEGPGEFSGDRPERQKSAGMCMGPVERKPIVAAEAVDLQNQPERLLCAMRETSRAPGSIVR